MKTAAWMMLGLTFAAGLAAQPTGGPVLGAPAMSSVKVPPVAPQSLSPATLDRIARMTSLFDGDTLNGWIQAPSAPLTFSANDLRDLPALVLKLRERPDAVSRFLGEQWDAAAQAALAATPSSPANTKELAAVVVKNLNRLVGGPSLYDEARFRDVRLRPTTEALREKNPRSQELMRLNRVLLEDAYPAELATSPSASWTVKDGAMASTGAGRGVIYTQADYAHYRLIFTMRHVSGKPDHKPCILIFCTRPPEGERGLDALGAIQFQTPNGGHWDYRPGQNNAGSGFKNPVKTTFDPHAWQQVEILVNAKRGTARMAVAQPVGSRAIENLTFADPTAGKIGPLAWQMHNSGLFDEFKDIKIEIDPSEDRLITVHGAAVIPVWP